MMNRTFNINMMKNHKYPFFLLIGICSYLIIDKVSFSEDLGVYSIGGTDHSVRIVEERSMLSPFGREAHFDVVIFDRSGHTVMVQNLTLKKSFGFKKPVLNNQGEIPIKKVGDRLVISIEIEINYEKISQDVVIGLMPKGES